jgi:hypothetical protein
MALWCVHSLSHINHAPSWACGYTYTALIFHSEATPPPRLALPLSANYLPIVLMYSYVQTPSLAGGKVCRTAIPATNGSKHCF